MTIYSNAWMHVKCVEPVKRKHGTFSGEWQSHRFPIKGGISWRDAMIYDMMLQKNQFVVEDSEGNLSFRGMPIRVVEAA